MPHQKGEADFFERRAVSVERVLIDVSDTLASGGRTGIQRVVRRLTSEFPAIAAERGIEVIVVAAVAGRFHALTPQGITRLVDAGAASADVAPAAASLVRRLSIGLERLPLLFEKLHGRLFAVRYGRVLQPLVAASPLEPATADAVFLADPAWRGTTAIAAARRARRRGARIASLVYDLIPVDHPEFMTPTIAAIFPPRLQSMMTVSDVAITISRDCAARLKAFLRPTLSIPAIVPVHLGSDLPVAAAPPAEAAPGFIVVGTIEPRKGHATALDAFELLWAQGYDLQLTFVGRLGWAHPDLVERCRTHPEIGRKLAMIHDADDDLLVTLLRGAQCVIMASTVEGFGLPIVEALAQGTPVIASDIPIFREIGGESVLYFDPADPAALAAAVLRVGSDANAWRARAADFTWSSWRDCAAAMLTEISGREACR